MTKFINNLNKYLSEMKIKQNCLSMLTGIDKNKLSRLLTGVQDESGTDMEKIAQALGKDVEFFLKDSISIPEINHFTFNKIAFYAGEPNSSFAPQIVPFTRLYRNKSCAKISSSFTPAVSAIVFINVSLESISP